MANPVPKPDPEPRFNPNSNSGPNRPEPWLQTYTDISLTLILKPGHRSY